ncbi:MAG: hypothetical protein ACRD5D_01570, partial [Candidatus Polarisedimenticolia bacterium]
ACRDRVAASVHIPRVDSPEPPASCEHTVGHVAAELGISINVVYYWIENEQVDARKGPGGRWLISFTPEQEAACRRRVAASVHLKPTTQPQTQSSTTGGAV